MKNMVVACVAMIMYSLLLGVPLLKGQSASSGTIVGTVRDSSGAFIPGATIDLENSATGFKMQARSSGDGAYTIPQVPPGAYKLTFTAAGFRKLTLNVDVRVAESALVDASLSVGDVSQQIEVTNDQGQLELETTNSSVGGVLEKQEIETLPTVQRQITQLVYLQAATTPLAGGGEGSIGGGSVAGGRTDQNTVTLDGIIITDQAEGGYLVSGTIASFPIPVDAIDEFRGTISNPTEEQARSGGGQFAMTSRRGGNNWHGVGYDYYQNSALNANTWVRNRLDQPRPNLISNRFGGSIGGPIRKDKTFFFLDYEGYRFPQHQDGERTGITESYRQGILKFADGTGVVRSYNFNPSLGPLAAGCGPSGSLPCDPRGIGINPIIQQYFNFYPVANDLSTGDGLNTAGIRAPVLTPIDTDFTLLRLDHNISQNWRMFAVFLEEPIRITDTTQLDFNPAVAGSNLLVSTSHIPQTPWFTAVAVTGQLSTNFTFDSRFGYNQQGFNFKRQFPTLLVPAAGESMQLAGIGNFVPGFMDNPGNSTTSVLGPELSQDKTSQWNNNVTWVKGNHVFGAGLMFQRMESYHQRTTQGNGATGVPVAQITSGIFLALPNTDAPPTCGGAVQTFCLPASSTANWNALYASLLGIWDSTQTYNPRTTSGDVLPGTSPLTYDQTANHFEITAADSWKIKPSLTLNYGFNITVETPYTDRNGKEFLIINSATGDLIDPPTLLQQKEQAALQGQTFNVPIGYVFAKDYKGGRPPYPTQFNVGPRAGLAWNPSFSNSLLGKLLGDRKTVISGGYALMHDQILNVMTTLEGVLGNPFLATPNNQIAVTCEAAGTPGLGCVPGSSPFRVGIDGPLFEAPVTAFNNPFIPPSRNVATGAPFGIPSIVGMDPNFHVGRIHGLNLTLQRQISKDIQVQVGWIGRYGRGLFNTTNVNAPPVLLTDMSGKSKQTFAQAFDAIAIQLRSGTSATNVAPQPWFENFFGPGSTATAAASGSSSIISGETGAFVLNTVDPMLQSMGKPTILNQQFGELGFQTDTGWENYNAGFVSLHAQTIKGLSLVANYTYAHCLDTGSQQADNSGGWPDNPYNIGFSYSACEIDIRHIGQVYGRYEIPSFKSQSDIARKALGGWFTSFIFTASSGLPIQIYAGDAFGGAPYGPGTGFTSATATGPVPKVGINSGVDGSNGVGTASNPSTGGTGLNLFADPAAVFANLRPIELSVDKRVQRGLFHGLGQWNLDASIGKDTHITERVNIKLTFDFFNFFNHTNLVTPGGQAQLAPLQSLSNPATFGVLTEDQSVNSGQNVGLGPRRVQTSLRIEF